MRDIKFRGQGLNNDEWYYGDLIHVEDRCFIITDDYYSENGTIELETCASPEVKPETVGMYTGLGDKTGWKIYEGDILIEYSNEIAYWVVSFEYGKFIGTCDNVCEDLYELTDLEIAGNIYDNPNLIEGIENE